MKLHVKCNEDGRPEVVHQVEDGRAPAGWQSMTVAEYDAIMASFPAAVDPDPIPEARQISKLAVRRKLRAMNKEAGLDAFLNANPTARADWDDAQFLLTTDPLFTTYASAVKTALSLGDEQFAELIK